MDVIEAVKGRRAINFFDAGKALPDEKLNELLELAALTPSSLNLQPWRVVAVRTPERKKALRKCASGQAKVEEASAVLIIVADPAALEDNIDRVLASMVALGYSDAKGAEGMKKFAGKKYGDKDGLPRKLFAVKNASFFAMSVMLAARGLGLETHPMDGFDEDAVKKEFGIAADKVIPVIIAVGWLKPGVKLLPRAWRRPASEFSSLV